MSKCIANCLMYRWSGKGSDSVIGNTLGTDSLRSQHRYEKDDTMGHRKLAVLLRTGKNRVKRVMPKYGIGARRKRKKYVYPDKTSQVAKKILAGRKQRRGS